MDYAEVTFSTILIGLCLAYVTGHVQVFKEEDFEGSAPAETENIMRNNQFVEDREHVEEHLKNKANINFKEATKAEMEFHFFLAHDSDGNQLLDGLELYHTIEHGTANYIQKIEADTSVTEAIKAEKIAMIYWRLTQNVDRILQEDDLDNDGYISYVEFVNARHVGQTLRAVALARQQTMS